MLEERRPTRSLRQIAYAGVRRYPPIQAKAVRRERGQADRSFRERREAKCPPLRSSDSSRRPPGSSSCHLVMINTTPPPGLSRVMSSVRDQFQTWSRYDGLSASACDFIGSSMIARLAWRPVMGPADPRRSIHPSVEICHRPAQRSSDLSE